ncbi:MAG TPA: cyclopropane-fatty-acyl-phospholipid synthase family protein [Afifellaceae bacterium]|nr:cyclopropane-fatty-acyl-phospholipid synthase family protein [Afifellaceae bacterium]
MRLLKNLLRAFIRKGTLTLYDADGGRHVFGGTEPGPAATLRLHDRALHRRLALNPELVAGEAYMDGTLTFEEGTSLDDLMALFGANRRGLEGHASQRVLRGLWRKVRRLQQHNPVSQAVRHARHHYDLKDELYALFLDEGMSYSCAYWRDPETETLEEAQENKLCHIAAKLRLEPGMEVLDIGSGWGALAIHLARQFDVRVTGLNPASNQLAASRRRAEAAGVAERIRFVEKDYRELDGRFDRIVSVGMMEHVGAAYFDRYFGKIRDLLAPDGFALIHAIGRMSPPGTTAPFIRKYIFPGGYSPSLSEVLASTERAGLWVCDVEVLRLHYAWTLAEWLRRFRANRDEVLKLYDERFFRMWEFYLLAAEDSFRTGSSMVFQLLVSRDRRAVPLLRDYMVDDERALAERRNA